MHVARKRRVGPYFQHRLFRAYAGKRKCHHNIEVGGKTPGGLAGITREYLEGRLEIADIDVVFKQVGCAGKTLGGLARDHTHRMNRALSGSDHRIQSDQRAGGHNDGATRVGGQLHQVVVAQQRAHRQHNEFLLGAQQGFCDLRQQLCWCAFDHDVGMLAQFAQSDHGHRRRKPAHKFSRLVDVLCRNGRKHKARDAAAIELERQRLANRPQPGDRDAHLSGPIRFAICHCISIFYFSKASHGEFSASCRRSPETRHRLDLTNKTPPGIAAWRRGLHQYGNPQSCFWMNPRMCG